MPTHDLTDSDADRVIRRTRALSAGLSGITGVTVQPGTGWAAAIPEKVLFYDLGLAAKLLAVGKDNAITGVIAHEVGHLIHTKDIDYGALPSDIQPGLRPTFHRLINALEDRRMELLMGEENPGYAQDFLDLQAAVVDTEEWHSLVKAAPVGQQFTMGVLLTAYGKEPITSIPAVAALIKEHAPAIVRMVRVSKSTQELACSVCSSGLWAAMQGLMSAGERVPGDGEQAGEGTEKGAGRHLTPDALAQLTRDQRQLLEDLVETSGDRKSAGAVKMRLENLDASVKRVNTTFARQARLKARSQDDNWHPGSDSRKTYDEYAAKFRGQSSTLARDLAGVLRENAFDRFTGGFRTGQRLNSAKLAGLAAGNYAVFKRKVSPKNRRYAVSVLLDVSTSMTRSRTKGVPTAMEMAHQASVLLLEALEQAGLSTAFYVFGSDVRCIKEFDQPLDLRKERIGGITALLSGATCMGWALQRVTTDLLQRYPGDDWQKVVIVVTDGQPNSCGKREHQLANDPKPHVRALESHGVAVIGIGLQTDAVKRIFTHHFTVHDLRVLGRLLARVMRKAVRKG